MKSYDDVAPGISAKTALWALPLLDGSRPPQSLGAIALETCLNLRTLAIMALLSQGNEQQFLANLSRSARAWALFLSRAKGASPRPHHYVSGRLDPILDGIAAGDETAVGWIAATTPPDKQGRSEYEDDYCYARLLLGLAAKPVDAEVLKPLLVRFRQFEDGARVAVCEALTRLDSAAFDKALYAVLSNFEKHCSEAAERSEETPEQIARSSICIEGLALLRLAERHALPTAGEYPLCPSLARLPYIGAFPSEFAV